MGGQEGGSRGVSNEDNGFLPGSLAEKMDPWLVPLRSNMRKVYNKPEILDKMEKEENIELVSLAHFRGRTFDNAICIVDEFQNLTKQQLQMVLSRLGKDSIMILTGDRYQIDLKFANDSAVHEVPKLTKSQFVNEIINTGFDVIDDLQNKYSDAMNSFAITTESDLELKMEDGYSLIREEFDLEVQDVLSDNFDVQTESDDFLDFTEADPFSEGGRY